MKLYNLFRRKIIIFHIALPNECPQRQLGTNHFFCLHYWIPIIYTTQEKGTPAPDWSSHCRHFPTWSDSVMRQRHLKINSQGKTNSRIKSTIVLCIERALDKEWLLAPMLLWTNYITLITSFNLIRPQFSHLKGMGVWWSGL